MLNPDFRDMLSACIAEDVEFLVVGAYALAAHGLAELVSNKRASGRPQDLADVARIEAELGPQR